MILDTNDYKFSGEQIAYAHQMASTLESFLKEYGVSDEAIQHIKKAKKIAKSSPKKILSLLEVWDPEPEVTTSVLGQSQVGGHRLVPGLYENASKFYEAEEEIPEELNDGVATAIQVVCNLCHGAGGDSMLSSCSNCSDGLLVIEVEEWDAWGRPQLKAQSWPLQGVLVHEVLKWERFFHSKFGDISASTLQEVEKFPERGWVSYQLSNGNFLLEPFDPSNLEDHEDYWLSDSPRLTEGEYEFLIDSELSCPECEKNSEDDEWEQDDCEVCEGSGIIVVHVPDMVGLRSDEEIIKLAIPG